ncbi:shikimate kinase [Acidianus sp. HS-5]|uniref:shikimate kinase n=1 Tax=Acidianus sp. HS-5 TaxID=2886040 RepID=UPI001F019B32|nr:shikimate kinase [Acidianus sp. HS-5]BDC19722.1 shikimate kinase [Acidianus sp. HS-5]
MQTYGGVSIVNAIPSWYGSSMAVNLKVKVDIIKGKYDGESKLVSSIINFLKTKFDLEDFDVKIYSEIPQESGLKSSSAVSTALLGEVKRKFNLDIDVVKYSAILSILAGVSYTGALDDATSAYYGGISYTYNKEFKIIKKSEPPSDISIIILARGGRNVNLNKLKEFELIFQEIFKMSLSDPITAMKYNGILVGEILGYDLNLVMKALKLGALASGVSGNGPSIFAVTKEGDEGPILDEFNLYGKTIVTKAVKLESQDK